ncbi:uncharacterized protein LOC106156531 isoform X2 [Lingula anatina]|uniref:Uncharacterized protein LOC106156531 isoform X2 n=1 Tax=Lingula anatina TaxID=7574 RepID=A0A1S3HMG2_LINAN|nr:uncharacterized protein LOC106156531 isoform X2 [Lingula anatina]|eukprot:XP_013387263.1 uncharacterized protein LOC106156531 isoform X2 [Lingula anatina]
MFLSTQVAKNCSTIQDGILLWLACPVDQAIQVLNVRYRQSISTGGCSQLADTVACTDVANNLQTRADLANECDWLDMCQVEIHPQPYAQCLLEAAITFRCLPVQYMCDGDGYRTEPRIYLASIDFPYPLPNDGSTCVCEFRGESNANYVTGNLLFSSRTHVSECQRTGAEESHLEISGSASLGPDCTRVNQYNVTTKLITVTLYGGGNPDPFLFIFEAADPGYLVSISCNMITVSSTTKLPPSNPPSTTTSNGQSGSGSNSGSGSGSNSGSGANSGSGSGSGQQNGTGQSDSLNIGMIVGIVAAAVVVVVVVIAVTVILLRRNRGAPESQSRPAPNMATHPSSEKLKMNSRDNSTRSSNAYSPPPFTRQKTSDTLYEEIPYDNPSFEGEGAKAPAPPPRPISTMAPTPGVYAGEYIDMTAGEKQPSENAYMGLVGPHSTAEYSGGTGSEYYLTPNP